MPTTRKTGISLQNSQMQADHGRNVLYPRPGGHAHDGRSDNRLCRTGGCGRERWKVFQAGRIFKEPSAGGRRPPGDRNVFRVNLGVFGKPRKILLVTGGEAADSLQLVYSGVFVAFFPV